jgi:hypothetical protein
MTCEDSGSEYWDIADARGDLIRDVAQTVRKAVDQTPASPPTPDLPENEFYLAIAREVVAKHGNAGNKYWVIADADGELAKTLLNGVNEAPGSPYDDEFYLAIAVAVFAKHGVRARSMAAAS